MQDMHENTTTLREKALLASVDTGEFDSEASIKELEELALTAEIDCVGYMIQNRQGIDTATCMGRGKAEELAQMVALHEADLVIFDRELSGAHIRNLEEILGVAVIDRTMLILDIFASHANTSEGRIQVELARCRYLLPRLSGMGKSLSRLGGGGAGGGGARRGAGESKLELDRRHIRRRITHLENKLEEMSDRRELMREKRKSNGVTTVAIIGYTNVGKSTLLNYLTNAGVLAEDKLFATLDPTSRALELPDGRTVMLIDTVGLVRRLPHHLVEAFKSTLQELVYADLLLNVCDISSEESAVQIEVTNNLVKELGADDIPVLTVLNKCDKIAEMPYIAGERTVAVSAKTGYGMEELLKKISILLKPSQHRMKLLIPYSAGSLIGEIRIEGKVLDEKYAEHGIELDALVDHKIVHKVQQFAVV